MVNRIIEEIQKSLEQENYIAALTMALTLPDICGKAEEPSEKKVGNRYKRWYKKHVAFYDEPASLYSADMPYLSEEIIYQLRNSLLHQGTPNVDGSRIEEEQCKVDKFILFVDDPYDSGLSTVSYGKGMKIVNRKLEVNLVLTCNRICRAAKEYYDNNAEKFDFFDYTFEDRKKSREEYERVLNLLQGKHEE